MVTVTRTLRIAAIKKAEVGLRQILDPRIVQRTRDALGLDPSQLPGAKSRV
jgi:hypothetical protein